MLFLCLGSIYAYSSRVFRINEHSLPYAWNHSISYDAEYGKMPFLVQRLTADDVYMDFDVSREVLQYQLTASIAKGSRSLYHLTIVSLSFHLYFTSSISSLC